MFNFIVLFLDFVIYLDSFDLNVFEKREKKHQISMDTSLVS